MATSRLGYQTLLALECPRPPRVRSITDSAITLATRRWLERAVIGLNLCPFAERVYRAEGIRFRVSRRRSAAGLAHDLRAELLHLYAADPVRCETTLLIHPWALNDFIEFNDFLPVCAATVDELGLEGEIQVASFHPRYQFAGTRPDDIENHTNRSPFPTLHLLREASVERALASVARPQSIYENNIARLRRLGRPGWDALWSDGEISPGSCASE